jgi:hypothetical protein
MRLSSSRQKTNNSRVEFDRSVGAIVSVTAKSNTNTYSGDYWKLLQQRLGRHQLFPLQPVRRGSPISKIISGAYSRMARCHFGRVPWCRQIETKPDNV